MSIHLVIHGKGSPLVLFHGWGFDHQIWYSLLPDLMKQHQVFLVDLPGFGLTPSMAWEPFKAALLNRLPTHFVVAGWSMGGLLATRLAIEEPQRVTHLINIASSPCFVRDLLWPGCDATLVQSFYQNLVSNPQGTLQQFIELQLQGQTVAPAMQGQTPSLMGLRAGLDILINWDLRNDLAQLHMPVSYMFGRLDAITPRKTLASMQVMYPHFNYMMFAKAAHVPFLSHPDLFLRALTEFLQ